MDLCWAGMGERGEAGGQGLQCRRSPSRETSDRAQRWQGLGPLQQVVALPEGHHVSAAWARWMRKLQATSPVGQSRCQTRCRGWTSRGTGGSPGTRALFLARQPPVAIAPEEWRSRPGVREDRVRASAARRSRPADRGRPIARRVRTMTATSRRDQWCHPRRLLDLASHRKGQRGRRQDPRRRRWEPRRGGRGMVGGEGGGHGGRVGRRRKVGGREVGGRKKRGR